MKGTIPQAQVLEQGEKRKRGGQQFSSPATWLRTKPARCLVSCLCDCGWNLPAASCPASVTVDETCPLPCALFPWLWMKGAHCLMPNSMTSHRDGLHSKLWGRINPSFLSEVAIIRHSVTAKRQVTHSYSSWKVFGLRNFHSALILPRATLNLASPWGCPENLTTGNTVWPCPSLTGLLLVVLDMGIKWYITRPSQCNLPFSLSYNYHRVCYWSQWWILGCSTLLT